MMARIVDRVLAVGVVTPQLIGEKFILRRDRPVAIAARVANVCFRMEAIRMEETR